MAIMDVPKAGQVVWYDFGVRYAVDGDMPKCRPAIIVSPTNVRRFGRSTYRKVFLVPLTSKVDNAENQNAVEVFNPHLNQDGEKKVRSFAICDAGLWVSLDEPSLLFYRGEMVGNVSPVVTVNGKQLDLILARSMQLMCGDDRLRRFATGDLKDLPAKVKERQIQSRKIKIARSPNAGFKRSANATTPARLHNLPRTEKPKQKQ